MPMGFQENMVLILRKGRCQGWLSSLSLASPDYPKKGSSLQNHKRKYTSLHTEPQNLITQVTLIITIYGENFQITFQGA